MVILEFLTEAVLTLRDALVAGLGRPADPDQRLYWGYLLGALGLAAVFGWLRHRRHRGNPAPAAILGHLFAPRIWAHRSARQDYPFLVLNPLLIGLLGVGGWVSVTGLTIAVADGLDDWLGPADGTWPGWLVAATLTTALFVADDFSRYVLHRLLHQVPALWALHKVHHSAQVLTPVTVYRIHPLESALYATRMALTQGLVVGVFFFAFGMRLTAWDIAGANLFTFLFNLTGANLRHSHIRLSYGRWLERVFISPAQHQLHHSNRPEHRHRNFGSFLAIWDGLCGTLLVAPGTRRHGFGIGVGRHRVTYAGVWDLYWRPVLECLRCLVPRWSPRSAGPRRLPVTRS